MSASCFPLAADLPASFSCLLVMCCVPFPDVWSISYSPAGHSHPVHPLFPARLSSPLPFLPCSWTLEGHGCLGCSSMGTGGSGRCKLFPFMWVNSQHYIKIFITKVSIWMLIWGGSWFAVPRTGPWAGPDSDDITAVAEWSGKVSPERMALIFAFALGVIHGGAFWPEKLLFAREVVSLEESLHWSMPDWWARKRGRTSRYLTPGSLDACLSLSFLYVWLCVEC